MQGHGTPNIVFYIILQSNIIVKGIFDRQQVTFTSQQVTKDN